MIYGVKRWNNRACYYVQTNNPTEELLKKRGGNNLLSCGPSAAVTCIAAMGRSVRIDCPGVFQPQPEEVLMDYFHDPRNYGKLEQVRAETPPDSWFGNEIPQFYPTAVQDVFGVSARFEWNTRIDLLRRYMNMGKAVQLCLKNPGHYIAVVAYDSIKQELIYNDPWPGRFTDRDGFNRRMSKDEFETNTKPFLIVYGVSEK